jgi:hypothetical protein
MVARRGGDAKSYTDKLEQEVAGNGSGGPVQLVISSAEANLSEPRSLGVASFPDDYKTEFHGSAPRTLWEHVNPYGRFDLDMCRPGCRSNDPYGGW